MRILIHNSDSPLNRGDRAILAGLIEVVRDRWPNAEIWALSQYAERDEAWFGIRFLAQSPYSVSPIDWVRLMRFARSCDLVLWGGGEILKDYTNRLGLVYWYLKLTLLRRANRSIVGAFQGIGPTRSRFGRRLIAMTVAQARVFIVRDAESAAKLRAWGVRIPLIDSVDPAVLGPLAPDVDQALARVGLSLRDVDGAIGFGVRRWFHYERGGWIPHRFRLRRTETPELGRYRRALAEAADELVERTGRSIVFVPMHVHHSEGDADFSREVIALMRHADRSRVLDSDELSSAELAAVLGRLHLMVASRLHSAILAATAGVPNFVLYYVDKGRLFAEQLGLARLAKPIESTLEDGAGAALADEVVSLEGEAAEVRALLPTRLASMRKRIVVDFATALSYWEDYDEEITRRTPRPSDPRRGIHLSGE